MTANIAGTSWPPEPDPVWYKLAELAECLCQTVADDPNCEPLCFCGVVPGGGIALDYIHTDECASKDGMGWVRMVTEFVTRAFPQPLTDATPCAAEVAFTAEVGLIRTFPISEDGEPPDAATYLAYSERQIGEAAMLRKVIVCCYGNSAVLGTYVPIGPQGGAIGGAWTLTSPTLDDD